RARDAEDLRGAILLIAGEGKHAHDVLAFDVVERRGNTLARRCPLALQREVLRAHNAAARDDDGARETVLELADVSGPRMLEQNGHRGVADHWFGVPARFCRAMYEVPREFTDVTDAFSQRRQRDLDDAKPVVEILSKAPVRDQPLEI